MNHWAMLPPFVVMKGFRFVGADIDVVKLAARVCKKHFRQIKNHIFGTITLQKLGFRPRFKMVLSFEALSQEVR